MDNELRECQYKYEQLQTLYTEQEDLLSQIFGGAYGSEEENRLESIFDQTEEMRNRIIEANFKWRQAQMMVDYAHKQLEFAVQKWKDIDEIDPGYDILFWLEIQVNQLINYSALEDRYAVAAETRNNLVAASQNIQGAQRYLSNIQFPYCAPSEVDTLNKVRNSSKSINWNLIHLKITGHGVYFHGYANQRTSRARFGVLLCHFPAMRSFAPVDHTGTPNP